MSLNELIERFTLVSGYERKQVSRYLPIILDCKDYFEERVGRELTDAERRRVTHACAVCAYYRISRLGSERNPVNFKAGDVQFVRNEDDSDIAGKLWEEEKSAIADIISFDDGFLFRAVSV